MTLGKQTVANAPARTGSLRDPFGAKREISHAPRPTASERIRQARELREAALDAGWGTSAFDVDPQGNSAHVGFGSDSEISCELDGAVA